MAGLGLPPLRRPGEEDDEDLFRVLDAPGPISLEEPEAPGAPVEPEPSGRATSSYDGSESLGRTHDIENKYAASKSFGHNLANAFRRQPTKQTDNRQLFAKQRAELASEPAQAQKRARGDANSEESAVAREMFAATHKDVWDSIPEKIRARMSHDYIVGLAPVLKGRLEKKDDGLTPEERRAVALADIELKRARAAYLKEPRGAKPVDPLDAEFKRLRNEKLAREGGATAKGTGGDPLLRIEGYELDPKFSVKPEVAEQLRKSQAGATTMGRQLEEVLKLYSQYGNAPLPGPARARMSSLITHAKLAAKSESQFGLGVLAGPDMAILDSAVPDVTSANATVADFFNGESPERLRVMLEQSRLKLDDALAARGYRKGASGGNFDLAGKVKIRRKSDGAVKAADKAKAEKILRDHPDKYEAVP